MNHLTHIQFPRRQQGSVLILVIAILAVLALLTLALTYSTRVELMASDNWADSIQASEIVKTAYPRFAPAQSGTARNAAPQLATAPVASRKPLNVQMQRADIVRTANEKSLNSRPAASSKALRQLALIDPALALADFAIEDESGKFNLNAIGLVTNARVTSGGSDLQIPTPAQPTEAMLTTFLTKIFELRNVRGVSPATLAHAIALYRLGPDAKPGKAGVNDQLQIEHRSSDFERPAQKINPIDEPIAFDGLDNDGDGQVDEPDEPIDDPAEALSDPRQKPVGDDRIFTSLEQLRTLPGMTPQAYQALEPYLTVFSVSHAAWILPSEAQSTENQTLGLPQIDPNTAGPELIFDTLRQRFPTAPEPLLAQFTINLMDRRDPDSIPSDFEWDGHTYYGQERIPFINEICPIVWPSETGGDDGQFIELINPYAEPLSLDGMSLTGAGEPLPLQGTLAPGDYLILTDDIDNMNDPKYESDREAANESSFAQRFFPAGLTMSQRRHIREFPDLDLTDKGGEIRLAGVTGGTVDLFTYNDRPWTGASRSFQRRDPRLRASQNAPSNPLKSNKGVEEFARQESEGNDGIKASAQSPMLQAYAIQLSNQDRSFRSPLEVMLVSTAWASPIQITEDDFADHPWALPTLTSESDNLDVRLVDCFRIGATPVEAGNNDTLEITIASRTPKNSKSKNEKSKIAQPDCDVTFGRLNLNTAPVAVLAALPGMNNQLLARIYQSRLAGPNPDRQAARPALPTDKSILLSAEDPLRAPRWRTLSDFILDETIWQNLPLYDRLLTVDPFAGLVTTHSMAFRVTSTTRGGAQEATQSAGLPTKPETATPARRINQMRAQRLLAGDRGVIETVDFHLTDHEPAS